MSEEQKTKEEMLFEDISFAIKYGIYLSVSFYAIDIIRGRNTIVIFFKKKFDMDKEQCDECLEREEL